MHVANKILRRNLAEAMKKKKNAILTALNTGALLIEMSSIDSLLIDSLAASVKAKGYTVKKLQGLNWDRNGFAVAETTSAPHMSW
mgnify:CR=1 FL=1